MVFTCGLAADILFYSFCEWIFYAGEPHIQEMGSIQEWDSTYPLFHWGFIPWAFYATLAACFGYMLHVKGVHKQKFSEACRPILKEKTDKWPGKLIDIITVIALIAGTATTFSVSTPLLSSAITTMLGIPDSKILTIIILIVTCLSYTTAVMRGMNGVSWLANACMILFGIMLLFVLVLGKQPVYILETGFSALGNMADHFIGLSTWTDPLRTSNFPQNWTIFYWAYWMVWCVASPFFMGSISRGRTVKQVILVAYIFGTSSTLISFIIFGNYGLGLQMHGIFDAVSSYAQSGAMLTGWQQINEKRCYFDSNGAMVKNRWIGDYYLGSYGYMAVSTTTPDGYQVGNDGRWVRSSSLIEGTSYIVNTKTLKFHYPWCHEVSKISSSNRADVGNSRNALISFGYEPCKICNP